KTKNRKSNSSVHVDGKTSFSRPVNLDFSFNREFSTKVKKIRNCRKAGCNPAFRHIHQGVFGKTPGAFLHKDFAKHPTTGEVFLYSRCSNPRCIHTKRNF